MHICFSICHCGIQYITCIVIAIINILRCSSGVVTTVNSTTLFIFPYKVFIRISFSSFYSNTRIPFESPLSFEECTLGNII